MPPAIQAAAQIEAWVASPSVRLIDETEDFWLVLQNLLRRPRVRGPVVHDARIAAICIAHGVEALLTGRQGTNPGLTAGLLWVAHGRDQCW
jgi:hypothetical protein